MAAKLDITPTDPKMPAKGTKSLLLRKTRSKRPPAKTATTHSASKKVKNTG